MEPALALELDHPSVYTQFLKQSIDEFLTDYQERYPVFQDWFRERKVERIYIGNAFCHLLFPEETTLFSMLDKAYKLGLKITVTFSYVREYQLKHMEKLLKKLEQWCREENTKLEIEVNDWAMADMLKYSLPDLIPCYGRMLNKRKKDPRMPYKRAMWNFCRRTISMQSFTGSIWNRSLESTVLSGKAAAMSRNSQSRPPDGRWKITCICPFTRPTLPSTARCMQGVFMETEQAATCDQL